MNGEQASGKQLRYSEQTADAARLGLYLTVAILLMTLDQRVGLGDTIRSRAGWLAVPFYELVQLPVRGFGALKDYLSARERLLAELDELERELLARGGEAVRARGLREENLALRRLLGAADALEERYQLARLSRVELDPFRHRILIDRGQHDGVYLGQTIIDADGLVGQVEQVGPVHSTVILLTDPSHAVPVQNARTGERTIAYGSGTTSIVELPEIPASSDVRRGDLLLTSGLGDHFPPGIPVARIERARRLRGSGFLQVEAMPAANIERSSLFLLIDRGGVSSRRSAAR